MRELHHESAAVESIALSSSTKIASVGMIIGDSSLMQICKMESAVSAESRGAILL